MNLKGVKIDAVSMGAGCLLGGAASAAGTYLLCRRVLRARMEAGFEERLDNEVALVKAHYNAKLKNHLSGSGLLANAGEGGHGGEGTTALGGQSRQAAHDDVDAGQAQEIDPLAGLEEEDADQHTDAADGSDDDEDPHPAVHRNVFREAGDVPGIRVVSREEFGEAPPGYQVLTLNYYEVDEVLCDDKDQPIRDIGKVAGRLTPGSFGGLSEDPYICLVINEPLQLCIEIIRKESSYTDAILGYGKPL